MMMFSRAICPRTRYFKIFVTTPAPTVRPPSRIANRSCSSIAIGGISSDVTGTVGLPAGGGTGVRGGKRKRRGGAVRPVGRGGATSWRGLRGAGAGGGGGGLWDL